MLITRAGRRPPSRNLAEGLRLLEWVSRWPGGTGVREAAAALNITHSSAHRFLETMRAAGWLRQSAVTKRYELGPTAVRLGLAALPQMDLRELARLPLRDLAERTGETAYLGILVADQVAYIDIVTGAHPIVVNRPVGWTTWAHCTAVGKVLLADRPAGEWDRLLNRRRLPRPGPRSAASRAVLIRELRRVRASGVALNDEESEAGVLGLAVPIRDSAGRTMAGLGLGGPRGRVWAKRARLLSLLRHYGSEISAMLGYADRSSPQAALALRRGVGGG